MKKIVILLLIVLSITNIAAQLIPEDRRIDWNPGIPGGIPEITSPEINVLDFGADPKGLIDSHLK